MKLIKSSNCESQIRMLKVVCLFVGCVHAMTVNGAPHADPHPSANHQVALYPALATVDASHSNGETPFTDASSKGNKRYLDGITSSFIKRKPDSKRYIDSVGSSLLKRQSLKADESKRYIDHIGSGLIKKSRVINNMTAFNLFNKQNQPNSKHTSAPDSVDKRYLDGITSSLLKQSLAYSEYNLDKRYLDGIASSLIRKRGNHEDKNKRYLDNIGSSLFKRNDLDDDTETFQMQSNKRYLDAIGSSLIKRQQNGYQMKKKYIDSVGSGLFKRYDSSNLNSRGSDVFEKSAKNSHESNLRKRSGELTNDAFVVKRDIHGK